MVSLRVVCRDCGMRWDFLSSVCGWLFPLFSRLSSLVHLKNYWAGGLATLTFMSSLITSESVFFSQKQEEYLVHVWDSSSEPRAGQVGMGSSSVCGVPASAVCRTDSWMGASGRQHGRLMVRFWILVTAATCQARPHVDTVTFCLTFIFIVANSTVLRKEPRRY